VGESGIASAPGAIAAAIEDAFPELDLRLERLPLTPERVWRALREAPPRAGSRTGGAR
jgi:carbon-monoxide dehydrogenase large subunit